MCGKIVFSFSSSFLRSDTNTSIDAPPVFMYCPRLPARTLRRTRCRSRARTAHEQCSRRTGAPAAAPVSRGPACTCLWSTFARKHHQTKCYHGVDCCHSDCFRYRYGKGWRCALSAPLLFLDAFGFCSFFVFGCDENHLSVRNSLFVLPAFLRRVWFLFVFRVWLRRKPPLGPKLPLRAPSFS